MQIRRASRSAARLRAALFGPAGSGKTYTALLIATHLNRQRGSQLPPLVIDTERGSSEKYANLQHPELGLLEFDVLPLNPPYAPARYVEALRLAAQSGYQVVVVDSLSHAWIGQGGALEMADAATARTKNSFAAWREVTPEHQKLVDAMISAPFDLIATMRSKTEYIVEQDERGRAVPRKVGLAPVQRDGMEYEFDLVADMDNAKLAVSKSRFFGLAGFAAHKPGLDFVRQLWAEMSGDGAQSQQTQAAKVETQPAEQSVPNASPDQQAQKATLAEMSAADYPPTDAPAQYIAEFCRLMAEQNGNQSPPREWWSALKVRFGWSPSKGMSLRDAYLSLAQKITAEEQHVANAG